MYIILNRQTCVDFVTKYIKFVFEAQPFIHNEESSSFRTLAISSNNIIKYYVYCYSL